MSDTEREFAEQSLTREQGKHPRMRLSYVQLRLGSRFFSVWWLLPGLLVLGAALVVAAKVFVATGTGQSFIHAHSCVPATPVKPGVEWWVIVTHLANFFFMVMIVRAGWQILADHPRLYAKLDCTPDREVLRFRGPVPKDRVWTAKDDAITLSPLFGMPGGRHTIGVARHWHFIFDILFVLNGIVYVVLLFATGRYLKLVPTQLSILPDAASCIVQYSALHLPTAPGGYFRFDAIQQLSYFGVVFLLGPLAILSGLAMSPALDNRFQVLPADLRQPPGRAHAALPDHVRVPGLLRRAHDDGRLDGFREQPRLDHPGHPGQRPQRSRAAVRRVGRHDRLQRLGGPLLLDPHAACCSGSPTPRSGA